MNSMLCRQTAPLAHRHTLLTAFRPICGTSHVLSLEKVTDSCATVNSHYASGSASWRDPSGRAPKVTKEIDMEETLNSHYANGNASWRDPTLNGRMVDSVSSEVSSDSCKIGSSAEPQDRMNSHYASGNASWRDPSAHPKRSMSTATFGKYGRSLSAASNGDNMQTLLRWRGGCDGHRTLHFIEQPKGNNSFNEPGFQVSSSFSEPGYQLLRRSMSTNSFIPAPKRQSQPTMRWIGGNEGHRHMSTTTFGRPKA